MPLPQHVISSYNLHGYWLFRQTLLQTVLHYPLHKQGQSPIIHRHANLIITSRFNCSFFFFCGGNSPTRGLAASLLRFLDHTMTHQNRYDSSGRVISPSQRPPTDNTLPSQQTDIQVIGGIRTHDLSQRVAADPRLRPRDYRDRLQYQLLSPTPNIITALVELVTTSALRSAEPKLHRL